MSPAAPWHRVALIIDLARWEEGGSGGGTASPSSSGVRIRWNVQEVRVDIRLGAAILGRCSEETRRQSENTLILNFHEGLQSSAITSPVSRPALNCSGNSFSGRRGEEGRGEMTTDEALGEEEKKKRAKP